jgi:aspartyl aminopeptidase
MIVFVQVILTMLLSLSLSFRSTLPRCYAKTFSSRSWLPSLDIPFKLTEEQNHRADRCANFLNESPEPYHVVKNVKDRLLSSGFREILESERWNVKTGEKLFFTRGGSSIVAFAVGEQFGKGNEFGCLKILGAHTDSPNLKIKPKSKRSLNSGMVQLNVECYGGGLWHTWFDRDLSVAGRVIIRDINNPLKFQTKLVKINEPILRIPNLCIHLRTPEERESFKVNKEDHLPPILCSEVYYQLSQSPAQNQSNSNDENEFQSWQSAQEPMLLHILAQTLQVPMDHIVDFDLSLYDTQLAIRNGIQGEFLCSSRIDNLASCFSILEAFVDHTTNPISSSSNNNTETSRLSSFQQDQDISIIAFFDHEEVGSESVVGAGSNLIANTIERLQQSFISSTVDLSERSEITQMMARK